MHTSSWTWGESLNPHNLQRTCGGSSGGDCGLVAARCVPLAIGTDIGGSIRFPSYFTGVNGFKPSPQRISTKGEGVVMEPLGPPVTFSRFITAEGPISRSVENLISVFKV